MKIEESKLKVQHEQFSLIRKGFVKATNGNELWVDTQTNEMIKIIVNDREIQHKLYCEHVKITIEVIDETEL